MRVFQDVAGVHRFPELTFVSNGRGLEHDKGALFLRPPGDSQCRRRNPVEVIGLRSRHLLDQGVRLTQCQWPVAGQPAATFRTSQREPVGLAPAAVLDETLDDDRGLDGLLVAEANQTDTSLAEVLANDFRRPVASEPLDRNCIPAKPCQNGHHISTGSSRRDELLRASFDNVCRNEPHAHASRRAACRFQHQVDARHNSHSPLSQSEKSVRGDAAGSTGSPYVADSTYGIPTLTGSAPPAWLLWS